MFLIVLSAYLWRPELRGKSIPYSATHLGAGMLAVPGSGMVFVWTRLDSPFPPSRDFGLWWIAGDLNVQLPGFSVLTLAISCVC